MEKLQKKKSSEMEDENINKPQLTHKATTNS